MCVQVCYLHQGSTLMFLQASAGTGIPRRQVGERIVWKRLHELPFSFV